MADLARDAVDAPLFAPAAEVLVHTDAHTLASATDENPPQAPAATPAKKSASPTNLHTGSAGRIDDGPPLAEAAIRRLACDGGIRLVVHSRAGATLDLGRRRRRPTRRQLFALWHRDRGCLVPGCEAVRFLHAHHVQPWARGGRTSIDNLVLLCGQHHRALHDGELHVAARGHQRFDVFSAGGAARPAAPPTNGSADDLTGAHPDITPDTATPDWDGAGLDLHEAVSNYLETWQLARQHARNHTQTVSRDPDRPDLVADPWQRALAVARQQDDLPAQC